MIEIPRAALTADEIAKEADFFCFGTNDLTQMTFGFSRDDAGKFLNAYYDAKIYENDPFAKLDQNGVGKLMEMALELGKPVNPQAPRAVSAVSTAATQHLLSSATRSVLTMYLAHHSEFQLLDLLLLRLLLQIGRSSLSFELPLSFEQAAAYRKANGQYVRKNQWRDTTVRVFIDLD